MISGGKQMFSGIRPPIVSFSGGRKSRCSQSCRRMISGFYSYGLEFKNLESNNEVTISHVLIITNTRTRTFYFCLFESVESKWKEAWKIGERIVQTLILNDDI